MLSKYFEIMVYEIILASINLRMYIINVRSKGVVITTYIFYTSFHVGGKLKTLFSIISILDYYS